MNGDQEKLAVVFVALFMDLGLILSIQWDAQRNKALGVGAHQKREINARR